MTDKMKIAELDKAIAEKEAELGRALQEKQAAEHDPERLVLAEKVERRISVQLQGLKAAREAAAYTPPAPTDAAELLQPLQKYRDKHAARVEQARASVAEAEAERREIEEGLKHAAVECDAALYVDLTERQQDNTAKLEALQKMRAEVEALPVFPEGSLKAEWAAICEKVMPDWNAAALRVETLAAEYRAACAEFLHLHDTLKEVRDQLTKAAMEENGTALYLAPVFMVTLNTESMILHRPDYIRIAGICSPAFGTAL